LITQRIVRLVEVKWVRRIVGAGLITLLFSACGAKYHLNRAIAKDPRILDSVALKVDTIVITENKALRDTIILQEYDTITLERNSVRIKLNRLYDTIRIDAQCLPDTIKIQKEIKVPQVVYQEKTFSNKYIIYLIISIILYTLLLIKLLK
jgi:hypothetical protein